MERNHPFVAIEAPAHRVPAAPLSNLKNDLLSDLRFAHAEHNGAGAEQSTIHVGRGSRRRRKSPTVLDDFLFGVLVIVAMTVFTSTVDALCHRLFALMPL